jgi:hypothetical protein
MPRGPFQGTFQPNVRPTIVTAPDAMVVINGETDIIGCPSCRRKFDWNKYVTSISVDLTVDGAPGSASISLSVPRHTIDDFYFEGTPVITTMMEVEIFAKGYYLVEGIPQYYPIFWGIVTEVADGYSAGEHTVTIHCADILKWWELCKMNINPAFTAPSGQAGRSIFGNVFFGKNPYDVIWQLAQSSFGDVVIGTGSLVSLSKDKGGQRPVFDAALSDMMLYWEERFSRIRSNLLLYGVNGVAVRGDSLYESYRSGGGIGKRPYASSAVGTANGGANGSQMFFDPTAPEVVAFRTQFNQAGQINFWQSEYQTKLELANAAKEAIGFEFFMDVTGDIVFKPPFYNLDILSNKPVSWIQDIDVIDWDFSESEAEVVTQLTLQGAWGGPVDYGMPSDITPFTSVTDYHLLRKYGWRSHTYNSEFMGDPNLMFYHGLDILDRLNSKRHRGTVTIPMRPELRLGFPIYVAPLDQIWYISGISHNIAFGGRAQTTLTLTAKRTKFIAPRGIGKLELGTYKAPPENNKAAPAQKGKEQKQAPLPATNLPFKYSSRQLSKYGVFKLTLGEAAQLPPVVDAAQEVQKNNPYEPLILRHPKTGRVVGYPNVVMAYTRPFQAVTIHEFRKNAGETTKPEALKPKNQVISAFFDAQAKREQADFEANESDRLRSKHLSNRYQYGLNSAGVYVYAYEATKVIGEVVMIPSANLSTVPATITGTDAQGKPIQVKPFLNQTSMIRPVSDERGFEVIGHFRYGRGLALRDGQLVYNNGGKNSKANIDLQVALSGDLFASLQAQSSGLTSIVSAYPNPVAALSQLQPEDLETAGITNPVGVANPDVTKPEFVPVGTGNSIQQGTNFVDSAPLGSPEQQGLTASVEASTLSRALTLAEMSVVDTNGAQDAKDDCMCLLGRSDLAFINVGYQVKTLDGAVPEVGGLFNANNFGGPGSVGGSFATGSAVSGVLPGGGIGATPVQPNLVVQSSEAVRNTVDQFLYSLYSALDDTHQTYESQLRGDSFASTDNQEFDNIINGQSGDHPPSDLTPPFSSLNRTPLGDPLATAQQGSSAKEGLVNTWSAFGSNLKGNAQRTLLLGQIAQDQADISKDQTQLAQLEATKHNNTTIIGAPSIDQQISTLQQQLASKQKDLADKQAKLAQIPPAQV